MICFPLSYVQNLLGCDVKEHLCLRQKRAAAAACNPRWLWAWICVYLTPSLPSAPCIVIHTEKGTCVWAWWLHNSRTSLVVAASHPTPNAPPAPLFRLCLGGRAPELQRDKNTDGIKCQVHMYKQSHIDVGTGACTALREIWLTCAEHMYRTLSVGIIMLITTRDCCVFLPSICLHKVTGVKRAFGAYGKTNKLLSLTVPWCYVIIKHLLIYLSLYLSVKLLFVNQTHLVCGSVKINAWTQQRWGLHNDHYLKRTQLSEQCAKNSIYNTALQLLVIWLLELSLKMLTLSEVE